MSECKFVDVPVETTNEILLRVLGKLLPPNLVISSGQCGSYHLGWSSPVVFPLVTTIPPKGSLFERAVWSTIMGRPMGYSVLGLPAIQGLCRYSSSHGGWNTQQVFYQQPLLVSSGYDVLASKIVQAFAEYNVILLPVNWNGRVSMAALQEMWMGHDKNPRKAITIRESEDDRRPFTAYLSNPLPRYYLSPPVASTD